MLPAPPSASPTGAPAGSAPPPPGAPERRPGTRRAVLALAGVAAVGCAYVAVFDPNHTSVYPGCPFRSLTGWDCPGCGATRAVRALVTGHPLRAVDHNALLVVAAVVGVVWFALNRLRTRRGQAPIVVRHPGRWGLAAGAVVVVFWVLRNLPWGPLPWLGSGAAGV